MNIDDRRPTNDRPTSGPIHTYWKISNGRNSATRRPIPFMFGSRVGFSGTFCKFTWPYLSTAFSDSRYVHRPYFALGLYTDCWRMW